MMISGVFKDVLVKAVHAYMLGHHVAARDMGNLLGVTGETIYMWLSHRHDKIRDANAAAIKRVCADEIATIQNDAGVSVKERECAKSLTQAADTAAEKDKKLAMYERNERLMRAFIAKGFKSNVLEKILEVLQENE